jgi:hypothetical protein
MATTTADPISMITPDPAADARRRVGLRRMRTLAVSLLLVAAAVYLLTLGQDGFWGFVNAGAEASMVGAPSPRCSATRSACRFPTRL